MFFCSFSSDPVKLYFPVPVELYTVFSDNRNLAETPGQKSGQKPGKQSAQKSGPFLIPF